MPSGGSKTKAWYGSFVKAFPAADRYVHRMVAGVGALMAAMGIGYTFDWGAATGGHIVIAIPNLADLKHGLYDFVNVYLFQQVAYDSTRRPPSMPHDEKV